ncbi:probable cysteine protease atg4 [Aspergillus udagawae]|uniref:Cysteine protease n=1 Tax=Aspergillus udagawae TaxID=91492 RepID=A0A8H3N823_9EURO|nr:cysteine protease atg4 [Aspergillus udagawae]GFF26782.1 probable cysteine protease atg4 [Aspergillus udagawae]GIC86476.1 cysteine protease atg4 [Aspergillus udagawae]
MNGVDMERCKRIIQYIWDPAPRNDQPEDPIWCLGTKYTTDGTERGNRRTASPKPMRLANEEGPSQLDPKATMPGLLDEQGWPESFLLDFESRIWITYRSNFPPIPKPIKQDAYSAMTLSVRLRSQLVDQHGFTSDTGWGCMIRSGQSLLANAMSILLFGRGWRRGINTDQEAQLLSQFADHPDAPFSIHRFVQHGAESCNKHPGEWFGPSATARCIQALVSQHGSLNLGVYMTDDTADVHEDKFLDAAHDERGSFRPTLILIGTRLGIDRITPVYWDAVKTTLQLPQSVGIAGGRPSASHYFVGVQGSHLFYLDPHQTRPALPQRSIDEQYTNEEIETYHTRRLRRIHVRDMDPSMLIGFIIKDKEDWTHWKSGVSVQGKAIVHVLSESDTAVFHGREGAIDEVEVLDDD